MTDGVVVILTALNLEYEAVHRHLDAPRPHWEQGTLFEVGMLRGTTCRVALALTGKGNGSSAVLAERAIQRFSPTAVLFVGVAGALWNTPLGDVVVATHVYAYHGGTNEEDGLKARPRVWEAAHGISQLAAHLSRTGDWTDALSEGAPTPKVHFGAIAAGEQVHNSSVSYEAKWIRDHYNDALAIEMEGAGVAQAGHLNGASVAIVRGISDWADGTKNTDDDGTWQPRAAANAAAFAVRLADELTREREHATMSSNAKSTNSVHNHVSGGQVGIQAATVTGSTVHLGTAPRVSSPTDLVAELAALRMTLNRERSAGTIDDRTYAAAQAELDIASTALLADTAEGKSTFVLALKRLRGLIADIAEPAAKIIALLAAANGLT